MDNSSLLRPPLRRGIAERADGACRARPIRSTARREHKADCRAPAGGRRRGAGAACARPLPASLDSEIRIPTLACARAQAPAPKLRLSSRRRQTMKTAKKAPNAADVAVAPDTFANPTPSPLPRAGTCCACSRVLAPRRRPGRCAPPSMPVSTRRARRPRPASPCRALACPPRTGHICDQPAVIYRGRSVDLAPVRKALCLPAHPYTRCAHRRPCRLRRRTPRRAC